MFYRTEAAIDLDAVDYNFENTRKKVPQGVKLLCVIKADAYGHGARCGGLRNLPWRCLATDRRR